MSAGAIRLTAQVVMIGSGELGLSEEHDSHVYLLDAGSQLIMIDSGAGVAPEAILENIRASGMPMDRISHLLITHAHADHAGGARYFRTELNLEICSGVKTARLLGEASEAGIALDVARAEGLYPDGYTYAPAKVTRALLEGDRLDLGECHIRVLETPGHSADSICFLIDLDDGPALFCGDALLADGTLALLNTLDSDLYAMRNSIAKIASLDLEGLYPGHGIFKIHGGSRTVRAQQERLVRSIYLPPILSR